MQIKIRKIGEKDVDQGYQFCIGIFEEFGWDKSFAYGFENLKEFFNGDREVFLVAKLKQEIVACGGVKELSKTDGLIKRFYVAKEFRGKGLAELMLEKIKQFAKEKNYKSIVVDIFQDNIRAKKFFQKQGFAVFSPRFLENWVESQHPKTFEFRKIDL
ncbi:GNAT family N-acetyltransferase [Patescibacteria group bacterium]|nr:GNAT family N-acetyltransferase [Patescibacteria group bacterium]